DYLRGFNRALDLHPGAPQFGQMRRVDWQPRRLAVHDGVKRAAKRHVGSYLPRADLYRKSTAQHERRNVHEGHARDTALSAFSWGSTRRSLANIARHRGSGGCEMAPRSNRSGWRVIHNGRAIAARQQQPSLERDGRDG